MTSNDLVITVAAIGAAPGVLALAWQIALQLRSAPRVRVRARHFASTGSNNALQHNLLVRVTNYGPIAAQVLTVDPGYTTARSRKANFVIDTGMSPYRGDPDLPFTLDAQHSAAWRFSWDHSAEDLIPWASVTFGTGQSVIPKWFKRSLR